MKDEPTDNMESPVRTDEMGFGTEMSRRAKVLNILALALVFSLSVGFVWLMGSLPRIEGRYPVKGLELPASVARDRFGVPHIVARTMRDAYFVLGFTHAQDRLWQMELQRRIGAGRLAEVVGEKALPSDRFMRTLGLYQQAQASFEKLDGATRQALLAYADGVNAWLAENRYRLPPEFLALGITPDKWVPADSLVWGRMMALQLTGNWRDELLRAKLAHRLDSRLLAQLWPSYPTDAPVTLSAAAADSLLAAIPDAARSHLASNVWAVAGKRTATGKPLLANDPHLGFQAPVLWYLAAIEAPGLTVAGATIPGVPFHLLGHNGRIAWGITTTHADTVDLFVEQTVGEESYQTPAGPRPFVRRQEVIAVKGGGDVVLEVRETAHGPVISDLGGRFGAEPGQVVAFRSTALEPDDRTAQALIKLNRAVDWKSFQAAMADFHAPVQNLAYADTAGNIGFVTAGRVPIRRGGDGSLPVPGWTGEGEWTGWVPASKLPQTFNPKKGRVVNANNRVVPDKYPYVVSAFWPEGYRAERIDAVLAAMDAATPEAMADLQTDNLSLAALELRDAIGAVEPSTPLARDAAGMLAAWDGRADRHRPEPLIFNAWMESLFRAVFADDLGDDFAAFAPVRPYVLLDALTRNRHWCDDVSTPQAESCEEIAANSLDRAVADLARRHGPDPRQWRWGAVHRAVFDHPVFSHIPLIGGFANLSIPTDGDDFTVGRGSFGADFRHLHGAGLRAVYDLSDLNNSRFVIATGQSGNPFSPHYDDMMKEWRDNRGITITNQPDTAAVLRLEPGY